MLKFSPCDLEVTKSESSGWCALVIFPKSNTLQLQVMRKHVSLIYRLRETRAEHRVCKRAPCLNRTPRPSEPSPLPLDLDPLRHIQLLLEDPISAMLEILGLQQLHEPRQKARVEGVG